MTAQEFEKWKKDRPLRKRREQEVANRQWAEVVQEEKAKALRTGDPADLAYANLLSAITAPNATQAEKDEAWSIYNRTAPWTDPFDGCYYNS